MKTSSVIRRAFALLLSFGLAVSLSAGAAVRQDKAARPRATPAARAPGAVDPGTVDLLTGSLSFSLDLASLPESGGDSLDISLSYSSRTRDAARTWNLEEPTGLAGLGWTLPRRLIFRDANGTGNTEDDRYYLADGDDFNELIAVTTGTAVLTFRPRRFEPWRITYEPARERWTIVREDGERHVYGGGDPGSGASDGDSVQWGVRWGNWIGDSATAASQSLFAVAWGLSRIEDTWGQARTFEYEQVRERVGAGLPAYTKAAYLKRVVSRAGDSAVFHYKEKMPDEFQDPHTEHAEPDAYQERYETRFLDSVQVFNRNSSLRYTARLSYALLGAGPMSKRLLTSVAFEAPSGRPWAPPPRRFAYWGQDATDDGVAVSRTDDSRLFNPSTGALYGALKSDTLPEGGAVRYRYGRVALPGTSRDLEVKPPANPMLNAWRHPRVTFGPNYVVALWSGNSRIHTSIYEWKGRWVEKDLDGMNVDLTTNVPDESRVRAETDFFTILMPDKGVVVCRKDALQPSGWLAALLPHQFEARSKVSMETGDRFVALLDGELGRVSLVAWDAFGAGIPFSEDLPSDAGNPLYALAAAKNWVLAMSGTPDNDFPPELRLYHFDGAHWTRARGAALQMPHFFDPEGMTENFFARDSGLKKMSLAAGGSLAALQVGHEVMPVGDRSGARATRTYFKHFAFTWPADFSSLQAAGSLVDPAFNSSQDSSVVLYPAGDTVNISYQGGAAAARFNGSSWDTASFDNTDANLAYAPDLLSLSSHPSDLTRRTLRFMQYDPNAATWGDTGVSYDESESHRVIDLVRNLTAAVSAALGAIPGEGFLIRGILGLAEINLQAGSYLAEGIIDEYLGASPKADGLAWAVLAAGNTVYYRGPDGAWSSMGDLAPNADKLYGRHALVSPGFLNFMAESGDGYGNWVQLIRNGAFQQRLSLSGKGLSTNPVFVPDDDSEPVQPVAQGDAFISYPFNAGKLWAASSFHLYRVVDGGVEGPLEDYAVTRVEVDDGAAPTFLHYAYEPASAAYDPAAGGALYNRVAAAPGGKEGPDPSQGVTESFFLNGAVAVSTAAHVAADTVLFCQDRGAASCVNAAADNRPEVTGLLYYSRVCANPSGGVCPEDAAPVTALSRSYRVTQVLSSASSKQPDLPFRSVHVRPWFESEQEDGAERRLWMEYNPDGLLSQATWNNSGPAGQETFQTQFSYGPDGYPALRDLNILDPVIQEMTTVAGPAGSGLVGAEAEVWKDWGGGRWALWRGFEARKGDLGDILWTAGAPAQPSRGWVQRYEVLSRDPGTGAPRKVADADGVAALTLYDRWGLFPVAGFMNAEEGQAGYWGFEDWESTAAWTTSGAVPADADAHTGAKSLTGAGVSVRAAAFSPRPDARYVVSAWVRPEPGASCGVGFGSPEAFSNPAVSGWQYVEAGLSSPPAALAPMASCTRGAIDDFRFGPVDSSFEAEVRDPVLGETAASLGPNGRAARLLLDGAGAPAASLDPDGQVLGLRAEGFAADGRPGSVVSVLPRGGGSRVAALALASGTPVTLSTSFAGDYGIRFQVAPDGGWMGVEAFNADLGALRVSWAGGSYRLTEAGTLRAQSALPPGSDWLLLALDRRLLFFSDGTLVFDFRASAPVTGPAAVSLQGEGAAAALRDVLVFRDPIPSLTFLDGLGRPSQKQTLNSSRDGIVLSDTLYDGWGHDAVHTLPAELPGSRFGFRPGSSTLDWATGAMSGLVADYYRQHPAPNQRPNDALYPYVRRLYESNAAGRVIAVGLPGEDFRITPGDPGAGRYWARTYGASAPASQLLNDLGLPADKSLFSTGVSYLPNDGDVRMAGVTVDDLEDRWAGLRRGGPGAWATFGHRVAYGVSGDAERLDTFLPPNFYADAGASSPDAYGSQVMTDARGGAVAASTPDAGGTDMLLDCAGRLRLALDADGRAQSPNRLLYRKYDALGRLTEEGVVAQNWDRGKLQTVVNARPEWPAEADGARWSARYAYDTDPEGDSRLQGRLQSLARRSGGDLVTESYIYDARDRVRSVKLQATGYDGGARFIRIAYDNLDNPMSVAYVAADGSSETAIYDYNALGRLRGVGAPGAPAAYAAYDYDINDEVTAARLAGGALTRSYQYDFRGSLLSIEDKAGGRTLFREELAYRDAGGVERGGRVLQATYSGDAVGTPHRWQYAYDALGRLTAAATVAAPDRGIASVPAWDVLSVRYDANGNILGFTQGGADRVFVYAPGGNRLLAASGGPAAGMYGYDANGDVTQAPGASFAYDPATGWTSRARAGAAAPVDFHYGRARAFGATEGGARKLLYVRDADAALVATEGEGGPRVYIAGADGPFAIKSGGEVSYLLRDHLGSTRALVDGTGTAQAAFTYLPFGSIAASNGPRQGDVLPRFAGLEWDPFTGLYDDGGRFYDPGLGRSLAPDPAGSLASPYASDGDPVNADLLDEVPLALLGEDDEGSSFPAGTEVAAETGPRSIETLQPGDRIWSLDEASGRAALNRVIGLRSRLAPELAVIRAGGQEIRATLEHPFLVEGRGWTAASDLKPGDALTALDGPPAHVEEVSRRAGPARVYNVEVDRAHTFYASAARATVHNPGKYEPLMNWTRMMARKNPNAQQYQVNNVIPQGQLAIAKAKLKKHAVKIKAAIQGQSYSGATVITTAIVKKNGQYKKYVFSNSKNVMSWKLRAVAHRKGYHVIKAPQAHAEMQFVMFSSWDPATKTIQGPRLKLVKMGTSMAHCAECFEGMSNVIPGFKGTPATSPLSADKNSFTIFKNFYTPPELLQTGVTTRFRNAAGQRGQPIAGYIYRP